MFFAKINYDKTPILSASMRELRCEILRRIAEKGGLYELGAKMFADDEVKGSYFIVECWQQCHNESAVNHWGKDLVADITHFSLELLRAEVRSNRDSG